MAGRSPDEGESEFPGEDEGGDFADGDLEAYLPFRRSPRESFLWGMVAGTFAPLAVEVSRAWSTRGLHTGRDAAASSAARLPLLC